MESDLKKTMPYTIPEGFFETMEERLMQEVESQKKKTMTHNVALWTGLAVAASLALLLVLRPVWRNTDKDSLQQVEMAFSQLSDFDQEMLVEYYEEIDNLDNF